MESALLKLPAPQRHRAVRRAAGGMPQPSPPCSLLVEGVCACGGLPAPDDPRRFVPVVSADAEVRRSLFLLLEAEGFSARAFCSLAALLGLLDRVETLSCDCVVIEEQQAGEVDPGALVQHLSRGGTARTIVVLTGGGLRPSWKKSAARGTIILVDPFRVDDVLRAVRGAPAPP